MGQACCKAAEEPEDERELGRVRTWRRPRWRSDEPVDEAELRRMREEFWDTEPHYGGDRVIWDALRAACEADAETARAIIESAGVAVAAPDMTVLYDERGAKYSLPKFVLAEPTNLIRGTSRRASRKSGGSGSARGSAAAADADEAAAAAAAPFDGGAAVER